MRLALAAAAALALLAPGAARADEAAPSGELRLVAEGRSAGPRGPAAQANALSPGQVPALPDTLALEAQWRHDLHARLGPLAAGLRLDALARHERSRASGASAGRFNELHASLDAGAWAFSAGRRIVAWDVGYGFRPNDVVQQEARRTLLARTPEGRGLAMVERLDADSADSWVWVNPQHVRDAGARGGDESALAARAYRRIGASDVFVFARHGRRTRASLGLAAATVAGDEWELHASWRAMQAHDRLQGPGDAALRRSDPWQPAAGGGASQWLLGASWTGSAQQSLMVEAWHDGTAPSDDEWRRWSARNAALWTSPAPAGARAGNLAWQAEPLAGPLRRDNLFLRAAWQPGPWLASLDLLLTPADGGRIVTAGLQWQGDRWRLNAAWRLYGGPSSALLAQLPQRQSGLLAATWTF